MSIEKLDMQSPDLVNENFEKLAELFPNCITETAEGKAIDFDLLKQELNYAVVDGTKERYRLEWPGKREAIVTANLPTTKTLRPVREDSVDFDNTENIYIEGDNLEVLKLLQESYLSKIKMIYIDPPYNTGKDFVYKDNFTQDIEAFKEESGQKDEYNQRLVVNPETAGRYHSDWLTMMYPRLKLARNLLKDDGVIFISIDENEVHNLRKVCDEIFGEKNCRGVVSRPTVTPSGQGYDILVNEIDYILVYSKSTNGSLIGLPFTIADEKIYDKKDEQGRYLIRTLRKTGGEDRREDRPSMYFGVKTPDGSEIFPIGPTGYQSRWRCGEESYHKMSKEGLIEWINSEGQWKVFQKFYLEGRLKQPSNLWNNIEGNKKGSLTTKNLLGGKFFDSPKPVELIERCLRISSESDSIILDFFSGSATTAHATLQLNSQDESKRKFIMVQLQEATDEKSEAYKANYKNICEIGKERIRRAAQEIKEKTGAKIDYGFRVYYLAESNMQDVYYKPQDYKQEILNLFADNVKKDRTGDDLLAQVMLDWGLPLSLTIVQTQIANKHVYQVAGNSLYACFDNDIDESFAKEIAKEQPLRIVFRDSGFKDDTSKSNVKQLLKQLSPETEMKVI